MYSSGILLPPFAYCKKCLLQNPLRKREVVGYNFWWMEKYEERKKIPGWKEGKHAHKHKSEKEWRNMKKVCENLWTSFLFSPMARKVGKKLHAKQKSLLLWLKPHTGIFLPCSLDVECPSKRLLSLYKIPFLVFRNEASEKVMSKVFFFQLFHNANSSFERCPQNSCKREWIEEICVENEVKFFFRWYCTLNEKLFRQKSRPRFSPLRVELNINKREKNFTLLNVLEV